jgi:hypothetical protein
MGRVVVKSYLWYTNKEYGENQKPSQYYMTCYDVWTACDSWLPCVVSVHSSWQFCSGQNTDDLWIAYANQWLNIPTDPRYGPVDALAAAGGIRCIIPIRPSGERWVLQLRLLKLQLWTGKWKMEAC